MRLFNRVKKSQSKKNKPIQQSVLGDKKFRLLIVLLLVVGTLAVLGPTRIGYRKNSQAAPLYIIDSTSHYILHYNSNGSADLHVSATANYLSVQNEPTVEFRITENGNCDTAKTTSPISELNIPSNSDAGMHTFAYDFKELTPGKTYLIKVKIQDSTSNSIDGELYCGTMGWVKSDNIYIAYPSIN